MVYKKQLKNKEETIKYRMEGTAQESLKAGPYK
jgi:hypothetical protein